MSTTYNGWTNYETWAVNLWMSNDQGSSEYWEEQAREVLEREDFDKDSAKSDLADMIQEQHDETQPAVDGVFSDLLNAAMSEVNWYEIAEHYIDDIDVYVAGWNMPGYMPDSEPAFFLEFDDAKRHILQEMTSHEDEYAEQGDESKAEDVSAAKEDVNLESKEFSVTVAGYAYWVSRA